jgi:hypothetical protein
MMSDGEAMGTEAMEVKESFHYLCDKHSECEWRGMGNVEKLFRGTE